ncbi:MAG: effector binding domain-containing protein [Bacilli bacterium]|nr:effector binding domain-containing protein [Bacilli bacterium]
MQQIGFVTDKYQISHRTLHYCENAGIIKSVRKENGYRYYDEANEEKIRRIIALKKLEFPLKSIEMICRATAPNAILVILKDHYLNMMHQTNVSYLLSQTVKKLISDLEMHPDSFNLFSCINQVSNPGDGLNPALKGELSMDETKREKELRIVQLPRMVVASISKSGKDPEDNCWKEVFKLIKEYQLDEQVGFRNLGFGYNDEAGNYIYELWITVPEDMSVPKPFRRIEFKGGLYATVPTYLSEIGEVWQELHDLVVNHPRYEHDIDPLRDMCLEECLDLVSFHDSATPLSERQLDLLLPIKRITEVHKEETSTLMVHHREVTLEKTHLAGTMIVLREATRPWKKRVAWYQLAQILYKVGSTMNECIHDGNNTWTIVYGRSVNPIPFYLDSEKGKVERVFAAVELKQSFSTYPEGLENHFLLPQRYLVFSQEINPEESKSIKLDFKACYEAAQLYFKGQENILEKGYCLERDYRQDGRYVDKIELYIPLPSIS